MSRGIITNLLHFLQVQTGPSRLPAVAVAILSVRGRRLVKVGQNYGPRHRRHHLELKAHGRRLQAVRRAGAEEHRAGGGGQTSARLDRRPGGRCRRPAAAQVPHLLVAGGAAVVIAVAMGERRHPLPVVAAADSLELFLRRVAVQIGVQNQAEAS